MPIGFKMLQKKYPPFSKSLRDLINKGYRPTNDVLIFIGNDAWKQACEKIKSAPERVICLPPWLSPNDFYFPVKECDILIFDTGYAEEDYLIELAERLYDDGANIVRLISPDHKLFIYHKEMCYA